LDICWLRTSICWDNGLCWAKITSQELNSNVEFLKLVEAIDSIIIIAPFAILNKAEPPKEASKSSLFEVEAHYKKYVVASSLQTVVGTLSQQNLESLLSFTQ